MKHIGIIKADTFIVVVNYVGIPCVIIYGVSMIVAPWFFGGWAYVQSVWREWQTLNASLLAFVSSVIALNISRLQANKQRERQFVAAKAFLPHALSELVAYFKASADLLHAAWEHIGDPARPLPVPACPELPKSYRETFSRCIETADPDVGAYLADILVHLQVHHARLSDVSNFLAGNGHTVLVRGNVKSYLYCLGRLHALTAQLFSFARGEEPFNNSSLSWEDYRNAYGNLGHWLLHEVDDLAEFTQRAISRGQESGGTR